MMTKTPPKVRRRHRAVGLGVVGDSEHTRAEHESDGAGKERGSEADENQVEHSVVLLLTSRRR